MTPELADRELLERLYAETGADRDPAVPGWLETISDLVRRLGDAFNRWLVGGLDRLGWSGQGVLWLVWGLGAVLALIALVLLVRGWRRRLPQRRRSQEASSVTLAEAADRRHRDAPGWWREVEARLTAGDVEGALGAGWWWLATRLGTEAEPSWTTRELVRRAGRPELLPVVRPFDAFTYGARRPRVEEVRGLLERLAEVLS
ncbi:MAG TPA: hypothetical protein VF017_11195 [Thermoanaerobaculia bacterium]|nr:hypothetical protein [Thermoanaerobaculia bacterium]